MHPHLKEAREGHSSKLKRIAGYHGTPRNPAGNESPGGTTGSFPGGAERAGEVLPNGPQAAVGLDNIKAEGKSPRRNLGKFARGGRTKKGTTVNVMVSPAPAAAPAAAPAMPMPHPPMPMAGPPPGGPGLPPGAGMPPPGGPPGGLPPGMMHKAGGRAFKAGGRTFDAGAVSGPGRLEKIKVYGKKAHMKPKAV